MQDSVWLSEAATALPAWAPVAEESLRCEVLVIGAGLAGCGTALALAERGVDVLVLDGAGPARGASGRNAGFVLLTHVLAYPELRARLGATGTVDFLALSRRNHALLRERFAAAAEHVPAGSLMLSVEGDEEETRTLEEAGRLLSEDGAEVVLGDPHPALRGFSRQLRVVEDAQLHPGRLVAAMASALPRGRVARVTRLDASGEAELAGGGRVRFDRAVVATNAHAAEVLPALRGVITPQRAQMLATAPLPARVLAEVAYASWGYDYFRQRADGRLLLGGRRHLFRESEATDVCEPTPEVQAALDAYVETHLPFAAGAEVERRWAGIMGFSPDDLPLLGPAPGMEGERVHVLAGFTGHGLGLAVALGELLARRLTGDADPDDERRAALFDPARLA